LQMTGRSSDFSDVRQLVKPGPYTGSHIRQFQQAANKLGLKLQNYNGISLDKVKRLGKIAILRLRKPEQLVVVEAVDSSHTLVVAGGREALIRNTMLAPRLTGEALLVGQPGEAKAVIDRPVRTIDSPSTALVKQKFTITNRSNRSLNLHVASISCGCTSARLSAESVLAGKSVFLYATVDPPAWGSERLVTVTMRTDDFSAPRITAAIHLKALPQVLTVPDRLFIRLHEGEKAQRSLLLMLPPSASVLKVQSQHSFVVATATKRKVVASGTSYNVAIAIGKDAPVGKFSSELVIHLKNAKVPWIGVGVAGVNGGIKVLKTPVE
jgi:hypothetical protein